MNKTLHENKRSETPSPSERGRLPISVVKLVEWTYAMQKADLMMSDGLGMCAPASVESQIGQILALGTRVDTSGVGASLAYAAAEHVAPDAASVHEVVSSYLPRDQRELVMMHGRLRTMPDPRIGARHRMAPKEWVYEKHGDSYLRVAEQVWRHREQAWWVPVVKVDDPDEVARDRERYSSWREGLATVLAVVKPRLVRHTLDDSFPAAHPWLGVETLGGPP